jgi:Uma2 family endonuclease
MAMATTRSGVFTYDDFCALVRDGQKADLIDGVIYMASPENTEANDLEGWLLIVMRSFVRRKNLGKVYVSRVAYRLDKKNAPEPDIGFVHKANLHRIKRGGIEGPPDLAVEIVSPESVERDYDKKRRQYEHFGVPEYWIIDQEQRKVTVFRLGARGKYREVRPRKGLYRSEVLTGFWLDARWLWQNPLPDELETVNRLLVDAT